MAKIRFMSQNQWNVTKNLENWEAMGLDCSAQCRMKGHADVFETLMPDIIGGQEVNWEMQKYLKLYCLEKNIHYASIWGHFTPIFYRTDKFEVVDSDYIYYPETMEGYEGCFNDVLSKSCNLAVFRDKRDGKVFIFANTHLWWKNGSNPDCSWYLRGSDEVRALQVKMANEMITRYQKKYGGCPIIFVGDMNSDYNGTAIRCALEECGFSHAHDVAVEFVDETAGYNGCGKQGPGHWKSSGFESAIDHILVRDIPDGAVRTFNRYSPDFYLCISDHSPVIADIEL